MPVEKPKIAPAPPLEEETRHTLAAIPRIPAGEVKGAFQENLQKTAKVAIVVKTILDEVAKRNPQLNESETFAVISDLAKKKAPIESVQIAMG